MGLSFSKIKEGAKNKSLGITSFILHELAYLFSSTILVAHFLAILGPGPLLSVLIMSAVLGSGVYYFITSNLIEEPKYKMTYAISNFFLQPSCTAIGYLVGTAAVPMTIMLGGATSVIATGAVLGALGGMIVGSILAHTIAGFKSYIDEVSGPESNKAIAHNYPREKEAYHDLKRKFKDISDTNMGPEI